MSKKDSQLLIILSISMGLVVILSNYLVQFQVNYFGLQNILTYGAFSYPVTFLIIDLANRAFGKKDARKIVYIGFIIGVITTLLISTNFSDLISIRIAIGSGIAFIISQNIDINIFDKLRNNKIWYVAPIVSSSLASVVDTFLFFSISFYNSGIGWVQLAFGDLCVKLIVALTMLIPFRYLMLKIKDFSQKISVDKSYKI